MTNHNTNGIPYTIPEDQEIRAFLQNADALLVGAEGWTLVLNIDVRAIKDGNLENMTSEPQVLARKDGWIAKRFRQIAYENNIPVFKSPLVNLQDLTDYVVFDTIPDALFKDIVIRSSNSDANKDMMWGLNPGETVFEWFDKNQWDLRSLYFEKQWHRKEVDRIERKRIRYIQERIESERARINDPDNETDIEYKKTFEQKVAELEAAIDSLHDAPFERDSDDFRMAALVGDVKKMSILLESPGKHMILEAKDSSGQTPLFYAVNGQNPEAVRFLIEKSASINVRDTDGRTPLHHATILVSIRTNRRVSIEIMAVLLEAGADPKLKDNKDRMPVDYAMEVDNYNPIELLRKYDR